MNPIQKSESIKAGLRKGFQDGASQIENDGLIDRYLYTGTHEAIISDKIFMEVQEEKHQRAETPEHSFAMKEIF